MRILFTGATSLAGRSLFALLRNHGHAVIGVSRKPPSMEGFCQADLELPGAVRALPDQPFDILIHFASWVPAEEKTASWENCSRANLHGTAHLLEWADQRVRRVILASSCAVYGPTLYSPTDERHPLHPETAYAISKYGQEQIVQAFCRSRHLPLCILRLGYVYGPGTPDNRVVVRFIKKVLAKEPITLNNSRATGMNLIHQDDIARMVLALLTDGEGVHNLGSSTFVSLYDYVEAVMKVTGRQTLIQLQEASNASVTGHYTSDLEKTYGLKPNVSLEAGIAGMLGAIA